MMTSSNRRRPALHDAGFTLMEVLVALAILGGALFILLDGHFSTLRIHDLMRSEVQLRQMLESTVAKAELEVMLDNFSGTGDFGKRYPEYTWQFEASRSGGEESMIDLYQVQVSVRGPEEERSVIFFVYNAAAQTGVSGSGIFSES